MRSSLFVRSLFALLLLAAPRIARAAEPPADAVASSAPPAAIVAVNPLPLSYRTISAQLELVPSPSLGIILNPNASFYDDEHEGLSSENREASTTRIRAFGGEVGLRFYPRPLGRGDVRLFLGPSFLLGVYDISNNDRTSPSCTCSRFGVAFDVGFTYVAPSGFTVGAGGGLQYSQMQGAASFGENGDGILSSVTTSSILFGSGVRPRFLLSLGWAI